MYGLLVLLGVITVVFLLFNVLPGDPARMMLGQRADQASIDAINKDLVYSGGKELTQEIAGTNVGKLILSPTRTYAPVAKMFFTELRPHIHGMVHCSGGAQTKVLHFIENLHVIKDNLFPIPPLFKLIQEQSGTLWQEMYKVFNMGHRLEVYLDEVHAQRIIEISQSFGIDAQIIGRVETAENKKVTIKSEFGEFVY